MSVCHQMGGIGGELPGSSRPLNLAGKGLCQEMFLTGRSYSPLQGLAKGVENTASLSHFRRRRVSFSIILSHHVENTSREMVVGELSMGALGSLVFSWVVPMPGT